MNKGLISTYMVFSEYPLEWMKEALNGVREQTYENMEFIFVCYGQDDMKGMVEALQVIDFPYKFFYRPELENFIEAIRFAVSKCQGEYVIRADADDILMPNAIKRMYEHIENEDANIVIPDFVLMGNGLVKGNVNRWICHALIEKDKWNYIKFAKGQYFRDGTSLIKTFEDYGFKIVYLEQPCFFHRPNETSITADVEDLKKWDDLIMHQPTAYKKLDK